MRVVQSLLFDSLLAQGRKDNLRFFADAINIAAKLASEHKGTIFAGISAAAESVDAPAPSKGKDDATTEAKESPESKRKWVDGAIKVCLPSTSLDAALPPLMLFGDPVRVTCW
jgi:hypothetical protein